MTSSRDELGALAQRGQKPLHAVEVQTKVARFSFPCAADETFLTAGLSAGYDLPYECTTGTCGSCHARVVTGSAHPGWSEAPGYAKLHPAKGDVLMCQAYPSSDCSLRVKSSSPQPDPLAPRVLRRLGRISDVRRLTEDVIHFDVDLDTPMDYEGGQFVGLRHPGVTGLRAYSMVDHRLAAESLGFVVKRKPGGRFSDAVFAPDLLGRELEVLGPFGRATFRPDERRNFVCIAGGSGVAGMMAILAHAARSGHFEHHDGHVFFGVRTRVDAFYLAEFAEALAAWGGRLRVVVALSHEDEVPTHHPAFPAIELAQGFVHEVAATRMRGIWSDEVAYVAGPQPMVDAAIRMLITEARLKPGDIRFDKFS